MSVHDAVHPHLLPSLEALLTISRTLSWAEREKMVNSALDALWEDTNRPSDLSPDFEHPKIVAALIRDLGNLPVTEAEQAILYSLSAVREHRDAGDEWLEAHPEEAAVLEGGDPPEPTVH